MFHFETPIRPFKPDVFVIRKNHGPPVDWNHWGVVVKAFILKRLVVALILTLTAKAGAKESVDLSKALNSSIQEKKTAERASAEKVRESGRRPAGESKERIIVDLSSLEK